MIDPEKEKIPDAKKSASSETCGIYAPIRISTRAENDTVDARPTVDL